MIEYHPHPTDPNLVVLKVKKRYIAKHSDEDLQAAVNAEREACASLCYSEGKVRLAETIRARGQK
jgi:hypothetical protein